MPGWHAATKSLLEEGDIRVVGIVQEQHADRARLFMQWKEMDWPILVDSLNLLEVGVVPITLAIDEHGIIRVIGPDRSAIRAEFVNVEFEAPGPPESVESPSRPSLDDLKRAAVANGDAASWEVYGSALFSWRPDAVDEAIAAYRKAIEIDPESAAAHFRLGVALRNRYDTSEARPEDFQAAVDQWSRALDINPNNYIYRRRIQQYGPRLDKPYPFYDWVDQARAEIEARGQTPIELAAEPGGAEIARPARSFETSTLTATKPDPEGKILRDQGKLVEIETTVVPAAVEPGATTRVHVVFRPAVSGDAHWNNEVDGLAVWLDPPEGWSVNRTLMTVANPDKPASREARRVEFELRSPESSDAGPATLPAYGLYYVCETARGACLYRRQDFDIPLSVR